MSEAMLDTGVWFAYYVKHDSFHQEANAIVDGLLLRKKKSFCRKHPVSSS